MDPAKTPEQLPTEEDQDIDSFSSVNQYLVYPEDDGYDRYRNPYSQV